MIMPIIYVVCGFGMGVSFTIAWQEYRKIKELRRELRRLDRLK